MQPACIMHTDLSVAGKAEASAADTRWAEWVARGVAQDTKSRRQSLVAAAVVAGGLGLWLAIALFG
jgi:hypothetical protein